MISSSVAAASSVTPERVCRLAWLTPARCRLSATAILSVGFLSHLYYLTHDCPIDLSGDEAYYWDWSRQLDLSYYSKGPLVALLIRLSCATFGDTMPAVRLPALALAVGTSILTYWLTQKLFSSDRLALAAVLLLHFVPIFLAGSVLMTVDAPLFFCWALATCLALPAVFHGRRWAWVAMGVAVGLGLLAKYTMLLWPMGLVLFQATDPPSRKHLRSFWPWLAAAIALVFALPVVAWNMGHDWVSLRHLAGQLGFSGPRPAPIVSLLEYIASQFLLIGPPLFIILSFAVVQALHKPVEENPTERAARFLLWTGLPPLAVAMLVSLRTKAQGNWTAPAYFTLTILAVWFLSTRRQSRISWGKWRVWCYATVFFGLAMLPVIHNAETAYPLADWVAARLAQDQFNVRAIDPTYKLRGWAELGASVSAELEQLGEGAFILSDHYQTAAEMAFYVKGQPKTYYAGSYFTNPAARGRLTQYDMWPDRRLDSPALIGRNAVYVGEMNQDIPRVFERVDRMPDVRIVRGRWEVRRFQYWRCIGFKSMRRPQDHATYY